MRFFIIYSFTMGALSEINPSHECHVSRLGCDAGGFQRPRLFPVYVCSVDVYECVWALVCPINKQLTSQFYCTCFHGTDIIGH